MFPKIALIMEVERRFVNKSIVYVVSHSKCFTSLLLLSIRPIYRIPADRSFEERSSATVDVIAPSNFPDFSCTNFRSENECEETRKRNMFSRREEGSRFSGRRLALEYTRAHINIGHA